MSASSPRSVCFFFSSRRRHTRCSRDWSSDVCSSDLHNDAAVEVHVWVKLALDKVGITKRGFLQTLRNVEQRIRNMQFGKQTVASLLDDRCAGIVLFIDPMAESHQPFAAVLVLGGGQKPGAIVPRTVD